MFYLALFIFGALVVGYIALAWAIIYHIQAYAVKGDLSGLMVTIFVVLSAGLLLAAMFFFVRIPWNTLGSFPAFGTFPLDSFR